MATPTLITVKGQFLRVDGTPETGVIEFHSKGYTLYSSGSTAIVPSRKVAALDSQGNLDIQVPATNDPAWAPSGWKYTLVLRLSSDYSIYDVDVPYDAPDGEITLAELIPVSGSTPINPANYAPLVHNHAAANIVSGIIASARLPIGTTSGTVAAGDHTHPGGGGPGGPIEISDVTGLTAALNGKANTSHTHILGDVTGLTTSLNSKANITHTHVVSDTTGLQAALDSKPATADLAEVAFSGSYDDLADKPSFPGAPVTSVAGRQGDVVLTKSDVGLSNVDNTSDANKPVSSATATALGNKANAVHNHAQSDVTGLVDALAAKVDPEDLATVATTGSYTDLTNKPTIPTVPVTSVAGKTGDVTLAKADVGLANVDNTSDANKPVSSAQQTALNGKANTSHIHAQSDVTNLTTDLAGKANTVHTHAQSDVTGLTTALNAKANSADLATVATTGSYNDLLDKPSGGGGGAVSSVAGRTGDVVLTKSDVGLANVDNTSDANKPISSATQTALNGKANTSHTHAISDTTNLQSSLDAKVAGPATATDNALVRFDATTGKLVQDSLVTVSDTGTVILTPQASVAYARGQLFYNSTTESLEFHNNDSSVAMQVGQEIWIRVWNATGSTIANGAPVYLSGVDATSGLPTVALANANAVATAQVAGLATEAIVTGASGYVTVVGTVSNINTSAFTAGATVFLATTAGTLTATAPASPNYRIVVGTVLVSNATTGRIVVRPAAPIVGFGTSNQILGMNSGGTGFEHKTVNGTANQISVTNAANAVTLALVSNTALPGAPTAATATAGTNTTQIATTAFVTTAVSGKADTSALTTLSGRVTAVEDMTPVVMVWNGSAYVESTTARVYVGPSDPGTVPDGSIWIDTDA